MKKVGWNLVDYRMAFQHLWLNVTENNLLGKVYVAFVESRVIKMSNELICRTSIK